MMIDTVVFDVGRVLYRWDLRHLFGKLIDDPQELEWFVSNVVTEAWHFEHDAGRDLQDMVAEKQQAFPDHAHLIEAYATRFNESIPGPVPGSLELVERLDEAGVPLFAITNFADAFWLPFRRTQPIFDRFRDIVVSGTEKLAKPGRAIFDLAQERFGIDPATTLFVDDNAANIAAAADVGWQVHHFQNADALEADLVARGLLAS
ncbi:HAD family hydrolase [Croceicoccus ponticola]|uniref:HAD family hydrolase n=1 Tax=Croceicoccus ponticola TaxID=2217664 RepID=A0A437GXA2_9SPHN|nr:HAD-IA family hydrolase [Croceicoccus ponticola]RVQ66999.1 HAD family hydrolase [Croceicoccus ponticola]